jgi:hypothetical protein
MYENYFKEGIMEDNYIELIQFISILGVLFKVVLGIMSLIVLLKLSKALDKYLKENKDE